jgi:hypothetical protein
MPAPENNIKLKNIFPSFFFKFRKGLVFSTFWSKKSISEKLFSKYDKRIAAVLDINSALKVLVESGLFAFKMAQSYVENHTTVKTHIFKFQQNTALSHSFKNTLMNAHERTHITC